MRWAATGAGWLLQSMCLEGMLLSLLWTMHGVDKHLLVLSTANFCFMEIDVITVITIVTIVITATGVPPPTS